MPQCSAVWRGLRRVPAHYRFLAISDHSPQYGRSACGRRRHRSADRRDAQRPSPLGSAIALRKRKTAFLLSTSPRDETRSEEHTSELQSLMRISYAVFCLKKKQILIHYYTSHTQQQSSQTH